MTLYIEVLLTVPVTLNILLEMLDLSTKKCVPCDSKDIRPMTEQSANELITKVCINPCLTFVLLLIRLYCFELIYQFRCRDGTCQVKVAPWSCSVLGKLRVSWKDWRCLRLLLMLQRLKVRFSSSISEEYRTPKPLSTFSLLRHIVPPIFCHGSEILIVYLADPITDVECS